jgi:hypothetical protein
MKTILLLTMSVFTTLAMGQVIRKCDTAPLRTLSDHIANPFELEVRDFLYTFAQECRSNVEYSEWSNELLFQLLDRHTELTIRTLEREETRLEIDAIVSDLEYQIAGRVDIKQLVPKIQKIDFRTSLKERILVALEKAEAAN